MKKTLLTLGFMAISIAAFAQGKILIENGLQPVWLGGTTLAADSALANTVLPYDSAAGGSVDNGLPSGKVIMFGLYGGPSLTLLTALPVNSGSGADFGQVNPANFTVPFAGGVPANFQVKLWDAPYASFEAQELAGTQDYFYVSSVFQVTPGINGNNPIDSGSLTTWAPGNLVLQVSAVPEPSTFALAGLGAAALLIFRRRK
jgi:hypothetical protein